MWMRQTDLELIVTFGFKDMETYPRNHQQTSDHKVHFTSSMKTY